MPADAMYLLGMPHPSSERQHVGLRLVIAIIQKHTWHAASGKTKLDFRLMHNLQHNPHVC